MAIVNELSTAYLTVTFFDKTGVVATPITVTWSAHDKSTGIEMQAETSLSPASSIEITIPKEVNAILFNRNVRETRLITVKATYGNNESINSYYEYTVANLKYVS